MWQCGSESNECIALKKLTRLLNIEFKKERKISYDEFTLVESRASNICRKFHLGQNGTVKYQNKAKIKHENNVTFSDIILLICCNICIAENPLIYMNDTSEISFIYCIKMNKRSIKLAMFSEMATNKALLEFIQLTAWLSVLSTTGLWEKLF